MLFRRRPKTVITIEQGETPDEIDLSVKFIPRRAANATVTEDTPKAHQIGLIGWASILYATRNEDGDS